MGTRVIPSRVPVTSALSLTYPYTARLDRLSPPSWPSNLARLSAPVAAGLRKAGVTKEAFLPPAPGAPSVYQRPAWLNPAVTLFPWQEEGLGWAQGREGAFLQWGTGAGKTLAGWLWGTGAALAHNGNPYPGPAPFLYVTASHLVPDVRSKIPGYAKAGYAPRFFTCEGKKPAVPDGDADIILCSWNLLPQWSEVLSLWLQQTGAGLVMDEIHYVREYSRRSRKVDPQGQIIYVNKNNWSYHAEVISRAASRRLGMTATPAPKGRHDMWSPLDLVEPGCWGSFWDFARRYCDAGETEYAVLAPRGPSNDDEFAARRDTLVHVVPRERVLASLPPFRREIVYLSPAEQNRVSAKSWKADPGSPPQEVRLTLAAASKNKWLLDTVESDLGAGLKLAVLTGRKAHAEALREGIAKLSPALLIYGDGDVSASERTRLAAAFRAGPPGTVLVGTRDAWGTGYDLQDADIAYAVQIPWTWEMLAQMEGRFPRPGQSRPFTMRYIVASGTYDEHMLEHVLGSLSDVQCSVNDSEVGSALSDLQDTSRDEAVVQSTLSMFANYKEE